MKCASDPNQTLPLRFLDQHETRHNQSQLPWAHASLPFHQPNASEEGTCLEQAISKQRYQDHGLVSHYWVLVLCFRRYAYLIPIPQGYDLVQTPVLHWALHSSNFQRNNPVQQNSILFCTVPCRTLVTLPDT